MASKILSVFILFLFLGCQQRAIVANTFLPIDDIFNFFNDLHKNYDKIQNVFSMEADNRYVKEEVLGGKIKVLNKLDIVADNIQNLKKDLTNNSFITDNTLIIKLNKLWKEADKIEVLYQQYKNNNLWNESYLTQFYNDVTTSGSNELSTTIQGIYNILKEKDDKNDNIFNLLAKISNVNLICTRNQSLQQVIYDLYQTAVATHARALTIQLFAYELKEHLEKKLLKEEKKAIIKNFFTSNNLLDPVLKAMQKASREIWKCDPVEQKQGTTYSHVQAFKMIVKEEEKQNEVPEHKKCNLGNFHECKRLTENRIFEVCLSKDNSDRVYEYMRANEYDDNFGKVNKKCKNGKGTYKLFSFNDLDHTCERCLCICEKVYHELLYYFSLSYVRSDVQRHMVITGVRIQLINRIHYLQIQQGRLKADGSIDATTVKWKAIEPYDYEIDLLYQVAWNQRTVFLDDLDSIEPNEIVIGVKFHKINDTLKLMVEKKIFNQKRGELMISKPHWEANTIDPKLRSPLIFEEPDDPLVIQENHIPDSLSGQYFKFQVTDLRKDLGQTTVPYMDLQPVLTNPPMPLSGVGLIHKGAKGSGGYIALKLMHSDLQKRLLRVHGFVPI